jgi:hypothetical protein
MLKYVLINKPGWTTLTHMDNDPKFLRVCYDKFDNHIESGHLILHVGDDEFNEFINSIEFKNEMKKRQMINNTSDNKSWNRNRRFISK